MTDTRTLREQIASLPRFYGTPGGMVILAEVLAILDAHPAPAKPEQADAVREAAPYVCRTCRRADPNWQLCNHPACADGR